MLAGVVSTWCSSIKVLKLVALSATAGSTNHLRIAENLKNSYVANACVIIKLAHLFPFFLRFFKNGSAAVFLAAGNPITVFSAPFGRPLFFVLVEE